MYSRDQRFIRTAEVIFERRKHYKDYRVINGVLLEFKESGLFPNDMADLARASEIDCQAETLIGVLRAGDYIKLAGTSTTLYEVTAIVEGHVETETGCRFYAREIGAVYGKTETGLKLLWVK